MHEAPGKNEKLVNEAISNEKKYTVNSNDYRQYEIICTNCNNNSTKNIPDNWFDNNDQLKEHNLPGGVSLEVAQNFLDSTICGACDPKIKDQLEKISQLNKNSK